RIGLEHPSKLNRIRTLKALETIGDQKSIALIKDVFDETIQPRKYTWEIKEKEKKEEDEKDQKPLTEEEAREKERQEELEEDIRYDRFEEEGLDELDNEVGGYSTPKAYAALLLARLGQKDYLDKIITACKTEDEKEEDEDEEFNWEDQALYEKAIEILAGKKHVPYYAKELKDAMSADPKVRFEAVRSLATEPYTEDAADILTKVAADAKASETTRGYAAMGLSNFTNKIPAVQKTEIQVALRTVVEKEKEDTPDGVIRTLIKWGNADFVEEVLGDALDNHSMQIEILERSSSKDANDKLWALYTKSSKSKKAVHYNKRAAIGRALAKRKDIRGIDILITLLPPESAPWPQYRNNIYNFLKRVLGQDFGYTFSNYNTELQNAYPKMTSWWEKNRSSFSFDVRSKE
ncbi:HEAT repeat domain-containing protein, partial [Planctomycetota bacterium]